MQEAIAQQTPDPRWIAPCARRLRQRWPRLATEQLDEVALELWRDGDLRALDPVEAASAWLGRGALIDAERRLGVKRRAAE